MKIADFKAKKVVESEVIYFSYRCDNGDEICIEPLLSGGFYVARYDQDQLLIGEKLRTKDTFNTIAPILEAVELANTLL